MAEQGKYIHFISNPFVAVAISIMEGGDDQAEATTRKNVLN